MTPLQQRGWEQFFQLVRDIKAELAVSRLDVTDASADAQVGGSYTYLNTSTAAHRASAGGLPGDAAA